MTRKETFEIAKEIFNILSSYDLTDTNNDNDYLMTYIYYRICRDLEEENMIKEE